MTPTDAVGEEAGRERRDAAESCRLRGHGGWRHFRHCLAEDLQRYFHQYPGVPVRDTVKRRIGAVFHHQVFCILVYRISHLFYARGWKGAARFFWRFNYFLLKVNISPASCIGAGLLLPHPVGLFFHGRAGQRLTLYAATVVGPRTAALEPPMERCPRLGDGVSVGAASCVSGPILVGDDVRISFNTVLDRDVPSATVVVSRALRPPTSRAADPSRSKKIPSVSDPPE